MEQVWVLMVETSALPAIQKPTSRDYAIVVEIFDEADIQARRFRRVSINWLLNSEPGKNSTVLADFVKKIDWLDGPSVGSIEFNSMRNLRDYLQNVRRLKKEDLYISSYFSVTNPTARRNLETGRPPIWIFETQQHSKLRVPLYSQKTGCNINIAMLTGTLMSFSESIGFPIKN